MRAVLEPIFPPTEEFFYPRRFEQEAFDHPLHFHPQVELVYIERSSGILMVGDHVGSFAPGFLCLIGSDLPHIFSNAAGHSNGAVAEVLQFSGEDDRGVFAGGEWRAFRALLSRASSGLVFDAGTSAKAAGLMKQIRTHAGLERWSAFIELAKVLVECEGTRTLASSAYPREDQLVKSERFGAVCRYILEHFRDNIPQREVAKRFGMAPASFSRLFKRSTRKTFQSFLVEVRLGHACRSLIETDEPITGIAFDCGFRNLSNFNRRFREHYQCSPREYRRRLA